MTTTSKQLRRKHRKSPKARRPGPHPSRASGIERLHGLEPAYIAWRSRTVTHGQAHDDWDGLLVLLESYANVWPFNAPDALAPRSVATMIKSIRRLPGDAACQALNRLDGYLHFLQDNGRWTAGSEDFDLLHLLVLMRIPGSAHRRTPRECPIDIPARHGHGIALVQWAAYLLDEMIEGKFIPNSTESLALPVTDPAGPILLAPGLYPLPLTIFMDLFTAMDEAELFETAGDECTWDEDEYVGEVSENSGELYPTHAGIALLDDGHPRNQDAIRSLLAAYLKIKIWAEAKPAVGLAGLRRAEERLALLADVSKQPSVERATTETNMLTLGEDIQDRLAERYGELSASIFVWLEAGVLEYTAGTLVAQPIVREAIKDLHDEYNERRRPATARDFAGGGRPS
ncbi:hypothetical protein OIU93_11795 [Paeniglutamicibacter sp. ZC-3]|uniref:hypothetical protein n=1 Tax=Paeniglutamicibacter sp. ZC-3 TaxID=2986919 RepID=UPI0021F6B099|nr:hypothetical protein [Paeniglutamicibacter sp. ZC-3]MCV9994976.1 hypothetical protein [Paeniglutamicibacter sp. ZC-3]